MLIIVGIQKAGLDLKNMITTEQKLDFQTGFLFVDVNNFKIYTMFFLIGILKQ